MLGTALEPVVPDAVRHSISLTRFEFSEDALDLLLLSVDRAAIVAATLKWIQATSVRAYHGTRLMESEIASIRDQGLLPLVPETRLSRLTRILSQHPQWPSVRDRLRMMLAAQGGIGKLRPREGQVHLTLSRAGLTLGFNHYLTHGSEYDQHVAHELLGTEGINLLSLDGKPMIVAVDVPGPIAIEAAHPNFTVDQMSNRGELPNLVRELLQAWALKLATPDFQTSMEKFDCGLCFLESVPANWISSIEEYQGIASKV